jgi:hypothetical protein
MTRRASLTAQEKHALVVDQGGRCAICGAGLLTAIWRDGNTIRTIVAEYDHWVPVALANTGKPDTALCKYCHAIKTKRDVKAIAKAKRLSGETGKNRRKAKIPSRGFDKRWRKRMDGTVERRT